MKVHIQNDMNLSLMVACKTKMGRLIEYKTDDCYLVSSDNVKLTSIFSQYDTEWVKQCFQDMLVITAFHISMKMSISADDSTTNISVLEHHLENDVTIYGEIAVATQIKDIVAVYFRLWKDHRNVVDVSELKWMNISLLNNWRENYESEQVKVYSVSQVNQELIDKIFDKLHE